MIDKNYTDCQECPTGIYKNENHNGFVFCDMCGHQVARKGEETEELSFLDYEPVILTDEYGGFRNFSEED